MAHEYVAALQQVLEAKADPQRAAAMKRYMRDQFEFLGIPSPELKLLTSSFLKEAGLPDSAEIEAIALELWSLPEREYQYFALSLLHRVRLQSPQKQLHLLEQLIVTRSWWDTVDLLASNLVGPLLAKHPELTAPAVQTYLSSGQMWLERTAILFQLKYKERTDVELLFQVILAFAGSKEFFLQKAIGWALREYSKTAPDTVRRFVAGHKLAPLSRREALKVMEREAVRNGTEQGELGLKRE